MKKYRFITACMLILLAFLLFNIFNWNRNSTIETFNADAATKEEITDELVIALFIEDITNAVTNFYSEYYSGEISVYDYEIEIVDIGKKEPGFISVKFGVTPQVGAHNPLGYDELAYRVDSSGSQKLAGYEHLKTYVVVVRQIKRGCFRQIKTVRQEAFGKHPVTLLSAYSAHWKKQQTTHAD